MNTPSVVQDYILSSAKNFLFKTNPREKLIQESRNSLEKHLIV